MGKGTMPFSVFRGPLAARGPHSQKGFHGIAVKSRINTLLLSTFGKLAMGDVASERVQSFLNRIRE